MIIKYSDNSSEELIEESEDYLDELGLEDGD